MAKHKNVIHLSEIPLEQMKTPEESSFTAVRQRAGAAGGGFRALYKKNSNVPYFEGESGAEIERIKMAAK